MNGRDRLFGGKDNDLVKGGAGRDRIVPGPRPRQGRRRGQGRPHQVAGRRAETWSTADVAATRGRRPQGPPTRLRAKALPSRKALTLAIDRQICARAHTQWRQAALKAGLLWPGTATSLQSVFNAVWATRCPQADHRQCAFASRDPRRRRARRAPAQTAPEAARPSSRASCWSASRAGAEKVLELPEGIGVGEARRAARQPAGRLRAPNYIARTSAVPNDPGRSAAPGIGGAPQWNFLPCGSLCGQSPTPLAVRGPGRRSTRWTPGACCKQRGRAGGKGARVAVLDTGHRLQAPRSPTFRKSPDFATKQFRPGYDFVKQQRSSRSDRDGHGTHVAGTIAERTDNGFAAHRPAPTGEAHPGPGAGRRRASATPATSPGHPLRRQAGRRRDQHELRVLAGGQLLQQDQERLHGDQVRLSSRAPWSPPRRQLERRAGRVPGPARARA